MCRQWVNQATVNRDSLLALRFPLPPLPEQRRIAEILDKAEALRANRRAALAQLDALAQAIFLDMLGDTSRWPLVSLDSICRTIRDGTHKTPSYVQSGIPFVTVKNMVTGSLDLSGAKFISPEEHQLLTKRVKPERGDILISKDGTIGAACPVATDAVFSIFVSVALLKLRPALVDQTYLVSQFRAPWVQGQIDDRIKGIAIRHLHLIDFKQLRIILPPLSLQREFARRVAAVEKLKATYRASLAEMDTLFASLQSRAFRGEL
jgi:type I restriction enzyme S subunit